MSDQVIPKDMFFTGMKEADKKGWIHLEQSAGF